MDNRQPRSLSGKSFRSGVCVCVCLPAKDLRSCLRCID